MWEERLLKPRLGKHASPEVALLWSHTRIESYIESYTKHPDFPPLSLSLFLFKFMLYLLEELIKITYPTPLLSELPTLHLSYQNYLPYTSPIRGRQRTRCGHRRGLFPR